MSLGSTLLGGNRGASDSYRHEERVGVEVSTTAILGTELLDVFGAGFLNQIQSGQLSRIEFFPFFLA
jgi:hypothetical protein